MKWTKEMLDEFCRLKYEEGLSLNQIAEAMGITKGAARNKNSRILKERRENQTEAAEISGNPVKTEEPDAWGDVMQLFAAKKLGRIKGEKLVVIGAMWGEILKKSGWRDGNIDEETVTKMLGAMLVAQWAMREDKEGWN